MMKGLTLIEIVIVIGLGVILILAANLFAGNRAITGQELERAYDLIRSELVKAQTDTLVGDGAQWGVYFAPRLITRFQGSSYASRNPSFDSVISFSSALTIAGATEVVFRAPEGLPSAPITITVTVTDGARTHTISVNAAGAISVD